MWVPYIGGNHGYNLAPRLLSTLPVPSRCKKPLVLSGHVIRARLSYEVGVGRLITFVSKCFKIVTVLFHQERTIKVCRAKKTYILRQD